MAIRKPRRLGAFNETAEIWIDSDSVVDDVGNTSRRRIPALERRETKCIFQQYAPR